MSRLKRGGLALLNFFWGGAPSPAQYTPMPMAPPFSGRVTANNIGKWSPFSAHKNSVSPQEIARFVRTYAAETVLSLPARPWTQRRPTATERTTTRRARPATNHEAHLQSAVSANVAVRARAGSVVPFALFVTETFRVFRRRILRSSPRARGQRRARSGFCFRARL